MNSWLIVMDACAMHRMTHPGRRIASVSNRDSVFPHAAWCRPSLHSRPNKRQPRSVELQQQQRPGPLASCFCFCGKILEVGDSSGIMSCVACCHRSNRLLPSRLNTIVVTRLGTSCMYRTLQGSIIDSSIFALSPANELHVPAANRQP